MLRLANAVSFIFIDDELGLYTKSLERVPEFVGLRRRSFDVAIAYNYKRRRFDLLYVCNRRALRIDGGIVVNGCSEEGDHPLIDSVLAVVALPIGDSRARDRGFEPISLGHGPHRHESAVAPSGDADAVVINRQRLHDEVDARQDVFQIAIAKVLHVCARECFALAVASSRVWHENEIAFVGEAGGVEKRSGPGRSHRRRRPSVNNYYHRVAPRRVVVAWIHQPSLNVEAIVGPPNTLGLSPGWLSALVQMSDLFPIAD